MKKSFFQKILDFFKGDSKPKQAPKKARSQERPKPKPDRNRPKRAPEVVEVTSTRLYVGNLSYDATEEHLMDLFKGVGTPQLAEVVSHRYTQRSKGYAFVEMGTIEEAKRAVEVLHDEEFMGRNLVVSGAKSPGERRGFSSEDQEGSDAIEDERDQDRDRD